MRKKIIVLSVGLLLVGGIAAVAQSDTFLYNDDRIVWILEAPGEWGQDPYFGPEEVYIIYTEVEVIPSRMEWSDQLIPEYRLCIEQFGWDTMWPGPMTWGSRGKICLTKQYIAGYQGGEIPRLDISGWHEININAGWVNIDSEFGTIIDGEEAHTIFIPAINKQD